MTHTESHTFAFCVQCQCVCVSARSRVEEKGLLMICWFEFLVEKENKSTISVIWSRSIFGTVPFLSLSTKVSGRPYSIRYILFFLLMLMLLPVIFIIIDRHRFNFAFQTFWFQNFDWIFSFLNHFISVRIFPFFKKIGNFTQFFLIYKKKTSPNFSFRERIVTYNFPVWIFKRHWKNTIDRLELKHK